MPNAKKLSVYLRHRDRRHLLVQKFDGICFLSILDPEGTLFDQVFKFLFIDVVFQSKCQVSRTKFFQTLNFEVPSCSDHIINIYWFNFNFLVLTSLGMRPIRKATTAHPNSTYDCCSFRFEFFNEQHVGYKEHIECQFDWDVRLFRVDEIQDDLQYLWRTINLCTQSVKAHVIVVGEAVSPNF